ncbi:MAG TPA: DUF2877 domain-containing protein, partial [Acidimicrobiales bacterium]|nr:DUF2877 domain-containing protein [Acidimicrobiales bacterium]
PRSPRAPGRPGAGEISRVGGLAGPESGPECGPECGAESGPECGAERLAGSAGHGGRGLAVGDGAIRHHGEPAVVVTRWFDPRVRLRRVDPVAIDRLAAHVSSRRRPDALLPPDAAERLADELDRGDAPAGARALLGRGTGLTPAGDDLLAGALAALRAVGSPAADDLGAAVRTLAPARTTRLSAALLDAADRGAVVPEAAAVLRATEAAAAPARRQGRAGALAGAVDRLVAVGHTSGWHLAAGLLAGLTHARRAAVAATAPGPSRRAAPRTLGTPAGSRP